MLKTLIIRNLILVEEAKLEFKPGLTVITGETGAGKTALIEAIRLILGERADASKVRKGIEKAYVCASFEGEFNSSLKPLFEELGLPFPEEEPLIISREISLEGKNRTFVSGQPAPLTFLQKIAPLLVDFVGQHAQVFMKSESQQRQILDQFGTINLISFQACLREEKEKEDRLAFLKQEKAGQPLTDLRSELDALEKLDYTPEEDQALFKEFSLLSNSEEITARSSEVAQLAEKALSICHEMRVHLEKIPIAEGAEMAKEVHLQLTEIGGLAHSLTAKMDPDPGRLSYLEERLREIDRAKKRFGKDLQGVKVELEKRVEFLSQVDEAIAEAENHLKLARTKTGEEAKALTHMRGKSAKGLASKLSSRLQMLGIEAAEVQIAVEPTYRNSFGDDQVSFLLRANLGEKIAPVKESSSGGEISRLLFCIKLILADQEGAKSLVFDEIDAGVGGRTAALMGGQMDLLAKGRQVFCVTHFPQVARMGEHHIRVVKFERDGRTLCSIKTLESDEREIEYLRMIGGAQKKAAAIPESQSDC